MNDALKTALDYAQRGWYVFPIKPKSKFPYAGFKWKELSTNDPKVIKKAGESKDYQDCNWALDCGRSGVFVLDIDIKEDVNGQDALINMDVEVPGDFYVGTPSGGQHIYFKGLGPNTTSKLGPGLDTRGNGGYVLIPGSINEKGKPYELIFADSLADIPQWITDKLGETLPQEKSEQRDIPITDLDKSHNIQSAIHYLQEQAPYAIEGQGGDQTTYEVCCRLRDFGLSEEKTFELILEYWNEQKAQPPWNAYELERKIANAHKYAKDRPGNASLEAMLPDPLRSTDMIRCAADINVAAIKPREWLLGYRYVPGYVTLTIAPGSAGKSLLTVVEGLAVASNKRLTYDEVKISGPVWLLNTEDPFEELARRVTAAAIHFKLTKEDLKDFYYTSSYENPIKLASYDNNRRVIVNDVVVDSIIRNIKQREIKLFIFDPFVECHTLNENDNTSIAIVAQIFRRIAAETHCAVSLVHHASQGDKNARGNADKSRGATSLVSAARIAHTLYPMTESEAKEYGLERKAAKWFMRLDNAKANLAPPADRFYWFEKQSVKVIKDDEETTGTVRPANIEQIKVEDPEDVIVNAVAKLLPIGSENSIYNLAKEIADTEMLSISYKTVQVKMNKLFAFPVTVGSTQFIMTQVEGKQGKMIAGLKAVEDLFDPLA